MSIELTPAYEETVFPVDFKGWSIDGPTPGQHSDAGPWTVEGPPFYESSYPYPYAISVQIEGEENAEEGNYTITYQVVIGTSIEGDTARVYVGGFRVGPPESGVGDPSC